MNHHYRHSNAQAAFDVVMRAVSSALQPRMAATAWHASVAAAIASLPSCKSDSMRSRSAGTAFIVAAACFSRVAGGLKPKYTCGPSGESSSRSRPAAVSGEPPYACMTIEGGSGATSPELRRDNRWPCARTQWRITGRPKSPANWS
eukprot:scaffold17515_cov30-Tisochrysis_lutea.AAC.5